MTGLQPYVPVVAVTLSPEPNPETVVDGTGNLEFTPLAVGPAGGTRSVA